MVGWEPPKCGTDCHRTYNSNRNSSVEKWAGGNPIMTGWESDYDRVGTSKHKKRWAGGNLTPFGVLKLYNPNGEGVLGSKSKAISLAL